MDKVLSIYFLCELLIPIFFVGYFYFHWLIIFGRWSVFFFHWSVFFLVEPNYFVGRYFSRWSEWFLWSLFFSSLGRSAHSTSIGWFLLGWCVERYLFWWSIFLALIDIHFVSSYLDCWFIFNLVGLYLLHWSTVFPLIDIFFVD